MGKRSREPDDNVEPNSCGEHNRYKYVNWHRGGGGWVVQVRNQDGKQATLGGLYPDQRAAALVAAKHLKVTVKSLEKTTPQKRPDAPKIAKWRHIYWHRRPDNRRPNWQVIIDGQFIGTRLLEEEAAKLAAYTLGCNIEDLKEERGLCLRRLLERLPVCIALRAGHLPGDLESAVRHQTTSRRSFNEEPALEVLSALGKYEPFRASLQKAWQSHCSKSCSSAVLQSCSPSSESNNNCCSPTEHLGLHGWRSAAGVAGQLRPFCV